MESIRIFYKNCPEPDYKKFLSNAVIIVDVRGRAEYLSGHLSDAINIPLEDLSQKINLIQNKNQPLLLCCSTGLRSASAKVLLESLGYTQVCNGGSWTYLQEKIFTYASI
jgi:phage shock protein E